MMRHLVFVRHGRYGYDDRLNDSGKEQIRALSEKLKLVVAGGSLTILTSPADRARESAEILATALGAEYEEHEILWDDESHAGDFKIALDLIRSRKDDFEVVILVTHLPYTEDFPSYVAREEFKTEVWSYEIPKGNAWVFDCHAKTLTRLSP